MSSRDKQLYEFGPFRIDTVERLLFRGNEMIPLTPKATDTLLALVASSGRVLEKDELIKMVWPDSFVEEGGLTQNISSLRKVLGGTSGEFQYIETIPKRGYRFVVPAKEGPPINGAETPAPDPVPQPPVYRNPTWRWAAWAAGALVLLVASVFAYFHFIPRAPAAHSMSTRLWSYRWITPRTIPRRNISLKE